MCLTAFLNFACGHERSPNDDFKEKKKSLVLCSVILVLGSFCLLFFFNFFYIELFFWIVLPLSSSVCSCQRMLQMPDLKQSSLLNHQ